MEFVKLIPKWRKLHFLLIFAVFAAPKFATSQVPDFSSRRPAPVLEEPNPEFCATVLYEEYLRAKGLMPTREQFEKWMEVKVAGYKSQNGDPRATPPVYVIPTIVHVVHNGQEIGEAENLSDELIWSQIDLLNEDFRKFFGSQGYNTNPIGADAEIEFCLAIRDTNGNPINGIDRIYGGRKTWDSISQIDSLMGKKFWPPDKYFNVWVCKFAGALNGYGGYARMSPGPLPGLPVTYKDSTDGVVLRNTSTGSYERYPFAFNMGLGRTLTHEAGHWLGLWHIWGDGDCTVDDYCADTPDGDGPNFGCPVGTVKCGNVQLVEDYMDYTTDGCINVFTNDQVTRMRTILTGSAYKSPLLSAGTCTPFADDAGVTALRSPEFISCDSLIVPVATVKNYGAANLTSMNIKYRINGGSIATFSWSGTLSPNDTMQVSLPSLSATTGSYLMEVWTGSPNGNADGGPANDSIAEYFHFSTGFVPPYLENFESAVFPPSGWQMYFKDSILVWDTASVPGFNCATTKAAWLNTSLGDPIWLLNPDGLVSPLIDLRNAGSAELIFDLAAASTAYAASDFLMIRVSPYCGICGEPEWDTLYMNYYDLLPTTASYYPAGNFFPACGEWGQDTVNLDSYTGMQIRIDFQASKLDGANLFLDNISVNASKAGTPEIAFLTSQTECEESSGESGPASGDCRPYHDISIPLRMLNSPTGDALVSLSISGGASDTIDYEVLSPVSLLFPTGFSGLKYLYLRIYDDEAVEGPETLNISFSISGSTNAIKASQDSVHSLIFADDDFHPVPGHRDTLLFEDFEGSNSGWTKDLTSPTSNTWFVGTTPGMTGNSAYISENNGAAYSYKNYFGDTRWRYTVLNTGSTPNPGIQFDYKCAGDQFDYGRFGYRLNTALDPWLNISPKLFNQTSVATWNGNFPAYALGKDLMLGFEWTCNGVTKTGVPFAVDNVLVYNDTYLEVETELSTYSTYFGPNDTIYFFNPADGNLMVRLVNNSNWDYGCSSLEIERAGTGASQFQSPSSLYDVTNKAFRIDMANDNTAGVYEISLYYTEAEIAGWEAATGQIRTDLLMIKTDSTILSVSPASPETATTICAAAAMSAFGDTAWAVTSVFTGGFSGFACGVCNTALEMAGIRLSGSMETETATLHWEAKDLGGRQEYSVLHALPGGEFEEIHFVPGSLTCEFDFVHLNPVPGINRYIVHGIGEEGDLVKSNAIAIMFDEEEPGLVSVFPNPNEGEFGISWKSATEESVSISIWDISGREIFERKRISSAGMNKDELDLKLPAGTFFLRISGNDWIGIQKFVVE